MTEDDAPGSVCLNSWKIVRQSAGCLQWGTGVIPQAAHVRLIDCEKLIKGLLRNLVSYKEGNYRSQVTGINIKIN